MVVKSNIEWHAADALDPTSYAHLANRATAAVHTVGILLESDYKSKESQASPIRNAIVGVAKGWGWNVGRSGGDSNPLHDSKYPGSGAASPASSSSRGNPRFSYEHMNRDSAIAVAHTFLSSLRHRSLQSAGTSASASSSAPAPFIYISAEDLFRPVVDARYIRTKRQAESAIARLAAHHHTPRPRSSDRDAPRATISDSDGAGLEGELRDESVTSGLDTDPSQSEVDRLQSYVRPVFLRPGLMYHPHTRPASTLPAAILEASAALHRSPPLPLPIPTPAQMIAKLGGGHDSSQSMARLLTTPPLHVDTVAKAVCAAIEDEGVFGPVDVYGIRKLAGWKDDASLNARVREEARAGSARPWPSNYQSPLQAAPRPTSHAAAGAPVGQHRTFISRARRSTTPIASEQISRRTFFNLPDLGKLASSALSSAAPKSASKDADSRSYSDAKVEPSTRPRRSLSPRPDAVRRSSRRRLVQALCPLLPGLSCSRTRSYPHRPVALTVCSASGTGQPHRRLRQVF